MACETRRPRHQSQLNPRFGGIHGGVNCTASSAAMVAEAVMCGPDRVILGKEVRRRSDEPEPLDPPGLTLRQVTEALEKITDKAVQLTIKQPIRADQLERRLRRGQVAVLQVQRRVLKQHGHDLGQAFAGTHAVAVGFDHDEFWVDDPLGRRKYTTTFDVIAEAAAALRLEGGATVGEGRAFAAFGKRPRTGKARLTIKIAPRTALKRFTMKGGLFFEVQGITTPSAVDGTCTEAMRTHAHPGGPAFGMRPRNLVVVLTGPDFLRGYGVLDEAPDVTIEELADDVELPPVGEAAATFDTMDVTSPDLVDDPEVLEVSEAARAALDAADVEPPGVKNEDVDESLLPDDFVEDDEDDVIRRDGS